MTRLASVAMVTDHHIGPGIGYYGLELAKCMQPYASTLLYKPFQPTKKDAALHQSIPLVRKIPYRSLKGLRPIFSRLLPALPCKTAAPTFTMPTGSWPDLVPWPCKKSLFWLPCTMCRCCISQSSAPGSSGFTAGHYSNSKKRVYPSWWFLNWQNAMPLPTRTIRKHWYT